MEDAQTIASFVPSYAASIEQAQRVKFGSSKYALLWVAGSVMIQSDIDGSFFITLLCEETVNLGVIEDYLAAVHNVLTPLCQGFQIE